MRERDWTEKARVQRYINWTLAIICFCCILCCGRAVIVWEKLSDEMEIFLQHQTVLSDRQMRLQEEKAKRDSVMAGEYFKQLNDYKKLPNYKGE